MSCNNLDTNWTIIRQTIIPKIRQIKSFKILFRPHLDFLDQHYFFRNIFL